MLKLVESKATGLSEQPPTEYQELRVTASGRCLYCGHPMFGRQCLADRCPCRDCVCCTGEEAHNGRGMD